ncbi:transposase [Hymenobacter lucidus]|uniref:Transposase n=1 Tax=Hymenobacter lucidus TaxID=2880930 RepID=A0ABS8ASQ8_9BACT|nr:transposase [Hymenobacter lucidus]MCB2409235.1 transposase [Hymenobacter lucidus]
MAKAIKAIECPKCGSTQKAPVRLDVFRCESCGTEYFLDNDDINVNHTFRHFSPPLAPVMPPARRALLAGVALGLLGLVWWLLFHQAAPPQPVFVVPPTVVAAAEAEEEPDKFTFSSQRALLYLSPTQKPVLLQVGSRHYQRATSADSSYARFVDATTGTALKSVALPIAPGTSSPNYDFKQFASGSGELYLIVNKTAVYRVDKASYAIKEVTKALFQGQPELASGIATVEAGDDDYGDYFNLFTNDGRNLLFFPLIHKAYTQDGFYDAKHGFKTLLPRSPTRTAFIFSRKSTTYPEDKIQLIKYQYRHNVGGAKDLPLFEWNDDYGGSGVFTDADPHRKVLVRPYELEQARVLSYADFTPGRLYFEPRLLYADADYVLLSFKPTASPTVPVSLQCLNARTAAIVFTRPLDTSDSPDRAIRYPAGFALQDGSQTYTLSLSGQLTQHPELP